MKAGISVVISAYNEEKNIIGCLESAKWADEIVVIDNSSLDKTAELAQKQGAIVYKRDNNLMLNINKNFGFTKASHEWILNLDADERVSEELKSEIIQAISKKESIVGYWIPRKNIIFGKWIQSKMWWPDFQLRLFKKEFGKFPEKHVHEYIQVNGKTQYIKSPFVHNNYTSVSQFIYKMDSIYTENEADLFIQSGKKISWIDSIRFPINDFLKTFFAQKGYRDGLHGLVLSFLQAFYAEVVFAKIWERQGFQEYENNFFLKHVYKEFRSVQREFEYWFLSIFIEEKIDRKKNILHKIKRKLISMRGKS